LLVAASLTLTVGHPSAEPMPPELRTLFDAPPAAPPVVPQPPSPTRHAIGPPVFRCGDGSEVTVLGRLPPEAILRTLRLNHGRFRGCFARAPGLKGAMGITLRFVIVADGSVDRTTLTVASDDPVAPALADCLASAVAEVGFPAPPGAPVQVGYPLRIFIGGAAFSVAARRAGAASR
jgi:hypothetical protein